MKKSFFIKVSVLILALLTSLSSLGCINQFMTPDKRPESSEKASEECLFESDQKINDLIVRYNNVSETDFPKESIQKGNIRNKAHISHNGLYITVVNSDINGFIDIRIEGSPSQKELLFTVFSDLLIALNDKLTTSEIKSAWTYIQNNTCRIDYYKDVGDSIYKVGGIQLQYLKATDAFPDIKIDMLYRYK